MSTPETNEITINSPLTALHFHTLAQRAHRLFGPPNITAHFTSSGPPKLSLGPQPNTSPLSPCYLTTNTTMRLQFISSISACKFYLSRLLSPYLWLFLFPNFRLVHRYINQDTSFCTFHPGPPSPHYSHSFTLIEAGPLLAYTISHLTELTALL